MRGGDKEIWGNTRGGDTCCMEVICEKIQHWFKKEKKKFVPAMSTFSLIQTGTDSTAACQEWDHHGNPPPPHTHLHLSGTPTARTKRARCGRHHTRHRRTHEDDGKINMLFLQHVGLRLRGGRQIERRREPETRG